MSRDIWIEAPRVFKPDYYDETWTPILKLPSADQFAIQYMEDKDELAYEAVKGLE